MESRSLEDFKKQVELAYASRAEVDSLEEKLEIKRKELEAIKLRILEELEKTGLENFRVPGLGLVGVQNKLYVTMPKDPEKKSKFMNYLKEQHLEDLLTVNHQTLNGFYKEQLERAIEEGNSDFSLPGLDEPKAMKTLYMRKG